MSKRLILGIFVAAVASAITASAVVVVGLGGASGEGAYGTLYIDVLPDASNTSTSIGTPDVCRDTDDLGGPLDVGDSFSVDIVVDDATEPIVGAQWELDYGPTVVKVTGSDWASWKLGSGLRMEEALPDSDGSFSTAWAGSAASGDGVLQRLSVQAVANGQSDLTLSDVAVSDADYNPRYPPEVLVHDPAGEVRVVVGGSCPRGGEGAGAPAPVPCPTPPASPEPTPQPTCKPTPPPPPPRTEAVRYRWANVSIEVPPRSGPTDIAVARHEGLADIYSPSPGTRVPALRIFKKVVVGDHIESSDVYVDATTGKVVHEDVRPEDRAEFDAFLATLRFEGPDPPDIWPYSDTPPEAPPQRMGNILFVEPDPASGIKVGGMLSDGPQGSAISLILSNGRSKRHIDAQTGQIVVASGEVLLEQVDERDREAFDRLTSTIELVCQ